MLAAASAPGADLDVLEDLASSALDEGEEELALPLISRTLEARPIARLWQWKALLERSLDEHEQALVSFAEAARLDPNDAGIAHGRARVALEAGVPAEQLYERALALAPTDGAVIVGLAAARVAAGRGEQAERELGSIVGQVPLWIEGQVQLAQLRSTLGRGAASLESLERALAADQRQPELWKTLFDLLVRREDYSGLLEAVEKGRAAGSPSRLTRGYETIAAAELGMTEHADRLFAESEADAALAIWRIRHLLRSGRAIEALPLIDRELAGPNSAGAWPYAATAWRMTGDGRLAWLQGDPHLVATFDLTPDLPPLDDIAAVLRSLHVAKAEYLDQSVRGGTQTDGPLFSRIDPAIRALRRAVVGAVQGYVARLPSPDPNHPLLGARRDRRIRFAGSWSVRLRGAGFHASHVHPQGWISSALYVALPPESAGKSDSGWLQLSEPPPDLRTELNPLALVKPEPGRLVLFPSWMWHGTIPFPEGERLTVAFDVSMPR